MKTSVGLCTMASAMQQFTLEDCKAALSDILDAFKLPENAARLNEARENAGNDMLKGMQIVFPVVAQIQMDVIHKYGFLAEGDGLVQFTKAVRLYETQDAEVSSLNQELRTIVMPPVGVSSHSDGSERCQLADSADSVKLSDRT